MSSSLELSWPVRHAVVLALVTSLILGTACLRLVGQQAAKPGISPTGIASHTVFIENIGQWPATVQFVRHSLGMSAIIERSAIGLELYGPPTQEARVDRLRFEFEGTTTAVVPVGVDQVTTAFNFFVGSDPERWRSGVRGFDRVRLNELYGGIDVQLRSTRAGLEYDLFLSPGAALDQVVVNCDGVRRLSVNPDGSLLIETALGELRQAPPKTWEVAAHGACHRLHCRYRLLGPQRFGFEVDSWSGGTALVIDPGLEWSTYFGGTGHEQVHAVAIADNGDVLVAGETESPSFPTTPGAYDPTCDPAGTCVDGFVSRLSADGTRIVFSTFIGGSMSDRVVDLHLHESGDVTLIGRTGSINFPVTPGALNSGGAGGYHSFMSRLTSDGSGLAVSAKFGGSIGEDPQGGLLDASGNVIVYGSTVSADFPTTPDALDGVKNLNSDGFLARVSADGSQLLYGSFLGGDGPDSIDAAMLEPSGRLVLTAVGGDEEGPPFPPATPGAFSTTYNGVYVARLSQDWSAIETATFLGGISSERARAIAPGPDGRIVVAGATYSPDFPVTPGAIQEIAPSTLATSGFVTCFDSNLSSLVFSTYLGGGPTATVLSVHVDVSGQVTVAGRTDGGGFPTTAGAFDLQPNGVDCFISRLSPDGRRLNYSTFLGGSLGETLGTTSIVAALAVDPLGSAVIATHSDSLDYPVTPAAYQGTLAGGLDAVVTKLDMLPTGVTKFGTSTAGCLGPLAAGVTSMPQVGSEDFAVTCTAAPLGSTQGLLAISFASLPVPQTAVGTQLWLDPLHLFALVPAKSVGAGYSTVGLRIPAASAAAGLSAFAQFFWKDPCGPAGWSASNALHIVVQP